MSPTETDIFYSRGVLKKADACGFFGVCCGCGCTYGSYGSCSCSCTCYVCCSAVAAPSAPLLRCTCSCSAIQCICNCSAVLCWYSMLQHWLTIYSSTLNALRCAALVRHLVSFRCADDCALRFETRNTAAQMEVNGFKT